MITATTRLWEISVCEPVLYVAFGLGQKRSWTLAMTSGFGAVPWVRAVGELRTGARWSGCWTRARAAVRAPERMRRS